MEKLKQLRKNAGKTQMQMSKMLGISQQAYATYETGRAQPPLDCLLKLAQYFNCTVDYLVGNSSANKQYNESIIIKMPVIGKIAAGYGGAAVEEHTGEYELVPTELFGGLPEEEFFVLRVVGDSMYPKLLDGDKVLVQRTSSVDSGTIAVVLYDSEEATVKRVEYVQGCDYVDLIPINPNYPPRRIQGVDLQECRILGKVIKLFRDVI